MKELIINPVSDKAEGENVTFRNDGGESEPWDVQQKHVHRASNIPVHELSAHMEFCNVGGRCSGLSKPCGRAFQGFEDRSVHAGCHDKEVIRSLFRPFHAKTWFPICI